MTILAFPIKGLDKISMKARKIAEPACYGVEKEGQRSANHGCW